MGAARRGAMAGNGGKMAKEEQLKKTKRQRTTRCKTEAKPRTNARPRKAVARKPPKVEAVEPADASGTGASSADGEKTLLDSVNRVVAANSTAIVKKLAEKAVAGNISSAKLLVDLVTKQKAPAKVRAKSQSARIGRLEDEPEWREEQAAGTDI